MEGRKERKGRGERKHISGGEGYVRLKEKRRRIIFPPLLPTPDRRFTCDAAGERDYQKAGEGRRGEERNSIKVFKEEGE